MTKKILTIALFNSCKLSAAAMGEAEDIPVGAHEPIEVPEKYALDLLENKFAYRLGDDEAGGSKPTKKQIAAAEKAVAAAKAALEKADETGKTAAETNLAEAEAELATLKG
ncbi:MAG TPA: hypothetical protein VGN93_30965 [Shinella sp.]|jgi:hypothetical protein|uniref:hypothetical protein n=1 Tax=Shinella sp. TaxID=1870904 RepID=UPI002E1039EC|nr:hypothetical protein [Shinella sp.]